MNKHVANQGLDKQIQYHGKLGYLLFAELRHARKFLHRDLKSQNVLLTQSGQHADCYSRQGDGGTKTARFGFRTCLLR